MGKIRYSQKPKGQEVGLVQKECNRPVKVELELLAEGIGEGLSFRPAACFGLSDDTFKSQQLFCVDIDNEGEKLLLPADAVKKAERSGYPVCFGYETFSSTDEKPKFRLCFLTAKPVKDRTVRDDLQRKLISLFGDAADRKCGNPARLFFGGNHGLFYTDYCARIPLVGMKAEDLPPIPEKPKEKPNTSQIQDDYSVNMDTVEAIRNHDADYIRSRFGYPVTRVFDNRDQFFSWMYRGIDMSALLGVKPGQPFRCILHNDKSPSANVFRSKTSGYWLYKCFSESCEYSQKALTVKAMIEIIGNFKTEYAALTWIKEAFNVSIAVSEWATEQEKNIDLMLRCLSTTGEDSFAQLCPVANKNIRYCRQLYMQILTVARGSIFPERMPKNDDGIVFYMSINSLSAASGKNRKKAGQYTKLLCYHGLLEILPDDEVPKPFLKKALQGTENAYNHISFYRVPSFVAEKLKEIELQGQRWKKYGYRIDGISYECFYRFEGEEVAKRLYPQTASYTDKQGNVKTKKPTEASDILTIELSKAILDMIDGKGFATEADVIALYPWNEQERIRRQLKRCLTEICLNYDLLKHKCSKADKERLGIVSDGYPTILEWGTG